MSKHVTTMTIHDVTHYSEAEKATIIASYPEHERDARTKGIPIMGSGKIFPIDEEDIKIEPFAIPKHWPQLNAMDFGYDHPFACVNIAWDRDADCIYITKTYRQSKATPLIHSGAIKPWGDWIPCAWPHDGYQHDKGDSSKQLKSEYVKHGLNMHHEHATHAEGGFGTEAGIMDMLERMNTERFKVFSNLNDWFEEFRIYHRKDGLIVKLRDDLMSASRMGCMMLRVARTKPAQAKKVKRRSWKTL